MGLRMVVLHAAAEQVQVQIRLDSNYKTATIIALVDPVRSCFTTTKISEQLGPPQKGSDLKKLAAKVRRTEGQHETIHCLAAARVV